MTIKLVFAILKWGSQNIMFNVFDDRRSLAQMETPRTFLIWQTKKEGFQNICVNQYLLCFFIKKEKSITLNFYA